MRDDAVLRHALPLGRITSHVSRVVVAGAAVGYLIQALLVPDHSMSVISAAQWALVAREGL